jgi:hypothetical protein
MKTGYAHVYPLWGKKANEDAPDAPVFTARRADTGERVGVMMGLIWSKPTYYNGMVEVTLD